MKRKITVLLVIVTFMINLSACRAADKTNRYQAQFLELFDTVTTIIGYARDEETFTEYAQMIHDDLEVYHELYDKYNSYEGINNIKTINDNAGTAPVKVDSKIIDLLKFSREAYELSDGKVNVAFGAVLEVWHEYRDAGLDDPDSAALPPMELLKEKEKHTDINQMVIDETASTVYLADSEMRLDVGAIAKGYATEQTAKMLNEKGITSILLSVGGNVRAIGSRDEKQKAWNVAIQNPDLQSDDKYLLVTELEDLSLVSSGDYERYYTVDGKEYHHIIDPITLMPAQYVTAVSIITMDSGFADALSTTIFNMPLEDGQKLIESLPDTEALWVEKDGEIIYSTGFQAYVQQR